MCARLTAHLTVHWPLFMACPGQGSSDTHAFYSPSSACAGEAPPVCHNGLEERVPFLEMRFDLSSVHSCISDYSLTEAAHYNSAMLMSDNSWSCGLKICIPHEIEDHSFHRHPTSPVLTKHPTRGGI